MINSIRVPLNSRDYNLIIKGLKTEVSVKLKDYWYQRLTSILPFDNDIKNFKPKKIDEVYFFNGYCDEDPKMILKVKSVLIRCGVEALKEDLDKKYFVLQLGKVLTSKNEYIHKAEKKCYCCGETKKNDAKNFQLNHTTDKLSSKCKLCIYELHEINKSKHLNLECDKNSKIQHSWELKSDRSTCLMDLYEMMNKWVYIDVINELN